MKDLLRIADLSPADMSVILDLADEFRTDPYRHDRLLNDESVFAYFTKPSTRTRVSLAEAVARLGGQLQFIGPHELDLVHGETIEDTAAVVSRYAKILIVRTFAHDDVVRLARAATVPVINARTDLHHPCQALADVMTIRHRRGRLRGTRIAYLGAGNNVAHSLMEATALVGAHLVVATPPRFAPDPGVTAEAQRMAATSGGSVTLTEHPFEAVAGADVVYTDAWTPMGDTEDGGSSETADSARTVPGERHVDVEGVVGLHLHALSPGVSRSRGDVRGVGRSAIGRARPGREPPPHRAGPDGCVAFVDVGGRTMMRMMVSLGGSVFGSDRSTIDLSAQHRVVASVAEKLAPALDGNEVVFTYGTGPEVGVLLLATASLLPETYPPDALDVEIADIGRAHPAIRVGSRCRTGMS